MSRILLPRVLIVSRRTVRKNKFVDFVGEYHLDLVVGYGAAPVIVPRVSGVQAMLDSFEPIHGVLLCEGEDIDPSLYNGGGGNLSPDQLDEVRRLHPSDAATDHDKDSIELLLARRCLARNIPILGICRGSQLINVACGGTLFQDVDHELAAVCRHINYDHYDEHRHPVRVVPGTPLHEWFGGEDQLMVNSYHHQGVQRLAERFVPMAFAPDGLIEGFYDADAYSPGEGKFVVGLQFHPERMRKVDEFDYPGCPMAYQQFVRAAVAYQAKLAVATTVPRNPPAKMMRAIAEQTEFLEEKRLKQMGATVRNSSGYLNRMTLTEEREGAARALMANMSASQLSSLASFYRAMGGICSEVLDTKQQQHYI